MESAEFKLDFITRTGYIESVLTDKREAYIGRMLFDRKISLLEMDSSGKWKFSMKNEPKYMLKIYCDRIYDSTNNRATFYRISEISYAKQKIYLEEIKKIFLDNFDSRIYRCKKEFNAEAELRKNDNEDENEKIIQKMIHRYVQFFMG